MKIALTVWEDRISPVFDAATTLLLVELGEGDILKKRLAPLHPIGSMRFAEMLKQMDVSVLICGAISEGHANRISLNGIELIPFVSGETERILETFASGKPIVPEFSMPGCGGQRCRRMPGPFDSVKDGEVRNMPGRDRTGPAGQGPGTGRGRGGCRSGTGSPGSRRTGRGQGRKGGPEQGRRRQPK